MVDDEVDHETFEEDRVEVMNKEIWEDALNMVALNGN
jgi:hypothetical protein